jgi:hypothetical protein
MGNGRYSVMSINLAMEMAKIPNKHMRNAVRFYIRSGNVPAKDVARLHKVSSGELCTWSARTFQHLRD